MKIDPTRHQYSLFARLVSLAALVIVTAALQVTSRISRTQDTRCILTTVVVCTEALKILVSFGAIGVEKRGIAAGFLYLLEEISSKRILWRKLLIPAILYTVQNNIVLLAIEYLDTGTYSILRQLKIPITAILWVLFMKARLSRTKWISLVVLMVGVMMVQTSSYENSVHISNSNSILTGLFCVMASCLTSGESLVCLVFWPVLQLL